MSDGAVLFGVKLEVDGFGAGDDSGMDFGFEVYDIFAEESNVFVLIGSESGALCDSAEHKVTAGYPNAIFLIFGGDVFENWDEGRFEDFIGVNDEDPVIFGLADGVVSGGFDISNWVVEEKGRPGFFDDFLGAVG